MLLSELLKMGTGVFLVKTGVIISRPRIIKITDKKPTSRGHNGHTYGLAAHYPIKKGGSHSTGAIGIYPFYHSNAAPLDGTVYLDGVIVKKVTRLEPPKFKHLEFSHE